MAQIYAPPIAAPTITTDDYQNNTWLAKEEQYIEQLAELCRKNGPSPLLGKTVRFHVADGYATYMVAKVRPLQLFELELGDAYQANDILLRGLNLADVKKLIAADERLAKIFGTPSSK